MATPLSDEQRNTALADLRLWRYDAEAKAIRRDFKFGGFSEAFAFMARVALAAEKADHHPEFTNVYDKVSLALSTHDAGGVTDKDIGLAARINVIAA